ncbi:hypothetical protein LBMAG57_25780 [Verrucomicrobiota bacterium]|nr:hypothetical protein LBMAG57_25780 [Verrucomicrobiota bacterium]
MVTRKTTHAWGPSIGLGALKTDQSKPTLKHDCKRKHRWVQRRFNRRCTRCGREEEKDPGTGVWENPVLDKQIIK